MPDVDGGNLLSWSTWKPIYNFMVYFAKYHYDYI